MSDIFHCFGDLPTELRDEIWQFAIQPSRPGAHIFKVYNQSIGEYEFVRRRHIATLADGLSSNRLVVHLFCPAVANNPSGYLIDWGLWAACKESRLAMQRHLRRESKVSDQELLPATVCFSGGNNRSADRLFTVYPHRDLFIFQPYNLRAVDWKSLKFSVSIGPNVSRFTEVKNIALEFRPEWGARMARLDFQALLNTPIVQALAGVVREVEYADTVWIVDYSLKRRRRESLVVAGFSIPVAVLPVVLEGQVFFARNRRFVEVTGQARMLGLWKPDHPVAYHAGSTSFVSALEFAVAMDTDPRLCRVGLLACEDL